MSSISAEALRELAPDGVIRAGINFGNPSLARGPADNPSGISIELSRELARRAGVPVRFIACMGAKEVFDGIRTGAWDIAFMAIEQARMNEAAFTAPYMSIEGVYLVAEDSPLRSPADVDRAGIRVGTTKGTAYALFLERNLKAAELIATDNGIEAFCRQKLDAAAGIRQQIAEYAKGRTDARIIDEPFMEIPQAMAVPVKKSAAAAYLRGFVEDVKASGFVAGKLRS